MRRRAGGFDASARTDVRVIGRRQRPAEDVVVALDVPYLHRLLARDERVATHLLATAAWRAAWCGEKKGGGPHGEDTQERRAASPRGREARDGHPVAPVGARDAKVSRARARDAHIYFPNEDFVVGLEQVVELHFGALLVSRRARTERDLVRRDRDAREVGLRAARSHGTCKQAGD